MGTYTTNKNLFMPSVGEQGWGELVNGNFSTIDTYLKPISLSGSTYTFTGNQTGGSVSATSITNSGTLTQTGTSTFTGKITGNGGIGTTSLTTSGTITSTGKITGNGGIGTTSLTTSGTITSTGKITANGGIGTTSLTTSSTITSAGLITVNGGIKGLHYVPGVVGTSGDANYATCAAVTLTFTADDAYTTPTQTFTVPNYSIVYGNPVKHTVGVYTRRSDLTGTTSPSVSTRTATVDFAFAYGYTAALFYRLQGTSTWSEMQTYGPSTKSLTLTVGKTYEMYAYCYSSDFVLNVDYVKLTFPALTTYKVKYATP